MKRPFLSLVLAPILAPVFLVGLSGFSCASANTPPAALAPGYSSQADQILGQSLSALHSAVQQATQDYPHLTPGQQGAEKSALNNFVAETNLADATYTAFHAGTATLAQAQGALSAANAAQTQFINISK